MKLAVANSAVEISGGNDTKQFGIAVNAKAFKVLSDTLYQNKIGSVVRELSCNAKDSHTMAGKADIPFVIHLPNSFEPWFAVKDFGVGLSPKAIVEVFSVYFQSTKDQSNDTVGAFGLGSKTPYSYTDQFTVTSVFNGVRTIYSAYVDETGMPNIMEMDSSSTDDCNGVEIKMSVRQHDFNTFANEVANQLKFFKVKPVVENANNFKFESITDKIIIESANFTLRNYTAYGIPQTWIIQGDVGYPMDYNLIKNKISERNLVVFNSLTGNTLYLHFEIGEIGVTASREGVEYNALTITNIDKKLDAVRDELLKYVNDQMKELNTNWEKAEFLNQSTIHKIANASGITIKDVTRNGWNGSGQYCFDYSKVILVKDAKGYLDHIAEIKSWQPGKTMRDSVSSYTLAPDINVEYYFCIRDTANRPNVRAKHFMATKNVNRDKRVMMIEIDYHDSANDTDKRIDELVEALGGFPRERIIRLSEVELPVAEKNSADKLRKSYTRPTFYRWKGESRSTITNIRDYERGFDSLIDYEEEAVYVLIKDMECVNSDDIAALNAYYYYNEIENNDVPVLMGIRENDLKKIEDRANFIPLQKYIQEVKQEYANDKKSFIKWKRNQLANHACTILPSYMFMNDVKAMLDVECNGTYIQRVIDLISRNKIQDNKQKNLLDSIAEFVGWNCNEDMVTKLRDKLYNRYCLLHVIGDWRTRQNVPADHWAKYFKAM